MRGCGFRGDGRQHEICLPRLVRQCAIRNGLRRCERMVCSLCGEKRRESLHTHSFRPWHLSRRAVGPGRAALVAACRSAVEWVIADHLLAVQVEEVLRGRAPRHVGEGRALTTQHCAAQLLQRELSRDKRNLKRKHKRGGREILTSLLKRQLCWAEKQYSLRNIMTCL